MMQSPYGGMGRFNHLHGILKLGNQQEGRRSRPLLLACLSLFPLSSKRSSLLLERTVNVLKSVAHSDFAELNIYTIAHVEYSPRT